MNCKLKILRQRDAKSDAYYETYDFSTDVSNPTVAYALNELNKMIENPIFWECSCLQKKCGACAMVINGRPCLACDARLSELKGDVITVEPLKKFPVICDLVVDRSVMQQNLREIKAWLNSDALQKDKKQELLFESSRCLQCGCCLEVCPNFYPGGKFFSMAAAVPVTRLLEQMSKADRAELRKQYSAHVYSGCGKSLACRNVCPAKLNIDELLVNSNAIALWGFLMK